MLQTHWFLISRVRSHLMQEEWSFRWSKPWGSGESSSMAQPWRRILMARPLKFTCASTWSGLRSAGLLNSRGNSVANCWPVVWPENCGEEERNGAQWGESRISGWYFRHFIIPTSNFSFSMFYYCYYFIIVWKRSSIQRRGPMGCHVWHLPRRHPISGEGFVPERP